MAIKTSALSLKKKAFISTYTSKKVWFLSKLSLGIVFLFLFLPYQPSFKIPPYQKNYVLAEETTIEQNIVSKSLPFAFQDPHPGYMSTPFSSYHPAIDLATGLGMPIRPIAPGKVISTGYDFWGLGLNVMIDHGEGYKSVYAHMGKIYVNQDQIVSENTLLGEVGLTGHTSGPHTHLEVMKDDVRIDPRIILPDIRTEPIANDFVATGSAALAQKVIVKPSATPEPQIKTPAPALSSLETKNVTESATKPITSIVSNILEKKI